MVLSSTVRHSEQITQDRTGQNAKFRLRGEVYMPRTIKVLGVYPIRKLLS